MSDPRKNSIMKRVLRLLVGLVILTLGSCYPVSLCLAIVGYQYSWPTWVWVPCALYAGLPLVAIICTLAYVIGEEYLP